MHFFEGDEKGVETAATCMIVWAGMERTTVSHGTEVPQAFWPQQPVSVSRNVVVSILINTVYLNTYLFMTTHLPERRLQVTVTCWLCCYSLELYSSFHFL